MRQSGNGHGHPDLPSSALTCYRTSQLQIKVRFTKILRLDAEPCAVKKSGPTDKSLASPASREGSGTQTDIFGDLLNLEDDRNALAAPVVNLVHGTFVRDLLKLR